MKMSSVKPIQKGGIKNKIICKYFMLGKCKKGENCPYLHSQVEKPKDVKEVACPMYSIGFCKNGPVCHFLHIKKDKYNEEEIEEKSTTSTTPKGEEHTNLNNENANTNNENIINDNSNENNLNNLKNSEEKEKEVNENMNEDNDGNYPMIPIWYLEHYYNKPISMIFSELEQKNLPEVVELKKKYGFTNIEPNLPVIQSFSKKNSKTNLNMNMNTLNLNFNSFNMNLAFNSNHKDINITNQKNNIIQNSVQLNQMNQIKSINNDVKYDAYKLKKDSIEYLINKEENLFYYLIRYKNYAQIKQSLDSNTIILPEDLYNKYKDIDIKSNKLTIIIFIYDDECENFTGFAQLKYPLNQKKSGAGEEIEKEETKSISTLNQYKIEWLWRTKLHYSKISHLLNRADNDHFLHEGKNGCPIDKDLGNYCCRLMIKRLSKDEVKELLNEKKIFEDQKNLLQNYKKEDHSIGGAYTNYQNNSNSKSNKNNIDLRESHSRYNNYKNNNNEKSSYKYSNKKSYINDTNNSKYNNSYSKNDYKYTGHKKYRNSSKSRSRSRSRNKRSDSEDYSNSYNKYKKKKTSDEKMNYNNNNNNYKHKNSDYNKYKYRSRKDYKESNKYYRYNDDNKSTDFSSKKSFH